MRIEEAFEIEVPIDRMFREINDVGEIGYCIAGVKEVRIVSADESQWKVEARAGFMARTFNLNGRIVERRPPEHLAFAGTGMDVEITGHVNLSPLSPTRTRCETVVEATVTGAFAPLVDMMAKGPQQALIAQTIENLRARLEAVAAGGEVPSGAAWLPAPDSGRPGPFARLLSWLRIVLGARNTS
jgi:carbon monoxide dehydrogenase subunit G